MDLMKKEYTAAQRESRSVIAELLNEDDNFETGTVTKVSHTKNSKKNQKGYDNWLNYQFETEQGTIARYYPEGAMLAFAEEAKAFDDKGTIDYSKLQFICTDGSLELIAA